MGAKSFEIKTYALDGTFIGTMDRSERVSDVSYSFQIDGGQTEFSIELDKEWQSAQYANGDFVRVFAYSDHHPEGKAIFTGQINGVERLYSAGVEKVRLRCLGLAFLLSSVIFRSGWSAVFDKNQSCGQTFKDVVDHFNSVYSGAWLSYVPSEVEAWPTANVHFEYTRCVDALKKCAEVSGFNWIIEPDGRARFFSSPVVGHVPALESEVQAVTANEDSEQSSNRYVLTWASGTVTVDDLTSQGQIGVREFRETDTGILDVWTANAKASAYLLANKGTKRKISIVLNGSYSFEDLTLWDDSETWDDSEIWEEVGSSGWIEDVRPGDSLSLANSLYAIACLKIVRIAYNPEELRLDLESYDSFGKEVIS